MYIYWCTLFSSGYPTTLGAYQINFGGGTNDIAISKLDSSGSSLIWATYLGGSGDDFPHSLIVNSKKELCVYGSTIHLIILQHLGHLILHEWIK